MLEILKHTPPWVFSLFFILLALGYSQSRDRTVGKTRAVIVPALMMVFSLYGVIADFSISALTFWCAGFIVTAIIGARLPERKARFSPDAGAFFLPGRWLPLILIMLLFLIKYIVGISMARQWPPVRSFAFAAVVCLLYGIFSGWFFSRIRVLQRLAKEAPPATDRSS